MANKNRFGQDKHRPEGKWVQATSMQKVEGVHHRKEQAKAFADAVRKAERKGLQCGLQLEHQPNNPHDRNAIAVFGVSEKKGIFSRGVGEWHIGYLDRELARELVDDFISKDIPIAAELHSIYESDSGFLDFNFVALAPPGHSESARRKRKNIAQP